MLESVRNWWILSSCKIKMHLTFLCLIKRCCSLWQATEVKTQLTVSAQSADLTLSHIRWQLTWFSASHGQPYYSVHYKSCSDLQLFLLPLTSTPAAPFFFFFKSRVWLNVISALSVFDYAAAEFIYELKLNTASQTWENEKCVGEKGDCTNRGNALPTKGRNRHAQAHTTHTHMMRQLRHLTASTLRVSINS